MKNTRLNYVVVGSFVLAMVVSLVVMVAFLAGRTGATDTYFTTYANVSGIKFGTQVLYEGYPIGQVETITVAEDTEQLMFRIEMTVQEGWKIPSDSIAQIASSGLLAAISIDIKAGVSKTPLSPGNDIMGGERSNLMGAISNIAGEFGDLSQQGLMPLLKNLNNTVKTVGEALNATAPEVLANVLMLSNDLAQKGPGITSNLVVFSKNFADISKELQTTKQRLDAVMTAVDGMVVGNKANVDQSLADLQHSLQAVARHIDSITYNLEGTSRNVHEFSRQIRQNPGVLLSGQSTADDAAGGKRK